MKGFLCFWPKLKKNRPPRVEQLFRKDSIWRGQQRLDAAYTADGTILAKHLEYTRPSSSDSESELLSFGSEQKGYTASSLFSSVEAGIRGFGYYTPAVAGPIVLSDDTSFWILDPATGNRRQVDLPIKARYMLPSLYGIPDSPWMVFEHEIDGDREIMGLNVDTAKVYNLTQESVR